MPLVGSCGISVAMLVELPDPERLPDDPQELRQQIIQLRECILLLQSENQELKRKLFGRRSEKISREELQGQLLLFEDQLDELLKKLEEEEAAADPGEEEAEDEPHGKPRRRRCVLPDGPREVLVHDVPEPERKCTCCGAELKQIGAEKNYQLEYVPPQLKTIEHVRLKYACPQCHSNVVIAPAPESPIPKGLPGPGLLSHVLVSKYCAHLPLYRQSALYETEGIVLPVSTLADWVARSAESLEPVHAVMKDDVLKSKVIHSDDTSVKVQPRHTVSETGKGRLWPYLGDPDHPHVVFEYTTSRHRDGPAEFLREYHGALQADAYAGYDGIYAGQAVVEVGCWAHARRYFKKARDTDPRRSAEVLSLIQKLFRTERHCQGLSAEERMGRRQRRSKLVIEKIEALTHRYLQEVLPKSPMGQALRYLRNQWRALTRFLEDGNLALDNNAAEREIRPVAVGRKNWLFFGSDEGGKRAAVIYSMIASCRRIGLDPREYLRDVLVRVRSTPKDRLWELTPWAWQQLRQPKPAAGPAPPAAAQPANAPGST